MFQGKNELEGEIETIVGPSVSLKGNLKSDGNISLKGKVAGDVKTKGDVFVDQDAEVKATISAKNVKVSGIVTGDIVTTGEVEITETGKVLGSVTSGALVVKMGAIFNGKSAMEGETAPKDTKEEKAIEPEVEVE